MIDIPWADLTPAGVILGGVVLIYFGFLVPKRFYDDAKRERDTWRQVAEKEQEHHRTQAETTQTMLALLRAIKGGGGDPT